MSILIQLLVFLSGTSSFSQNLHLPGYIITNQGDTVDGFITVKGDRRLAKICNFSTTQNGLYRDFSPDELQGYRFQSGKFYVSRELQISERATKYFLEYLINGKANIYYLRTTEDLYFIERSKGRIVELNGKEKTIQTPDGTFIKNSEYKGLLIAELSDWKDAPNEVQKSSLTHASLIDLAQKYHKNTCTDSNCIIYERKINKLKLRYGMTVGVSAFTVMFGGKLGTSPAPGFQLGVKLELLNSTYSRNRLIYQIDVQLFHVNRTTLYASEDYPFSEKVLYEGHSYYLTSKDKSSTPGIVDYVRNLDIDLKLYTLKVPLAINYYLMEGRTRPYIGAGISTEMILGQNKDFDYPFYSSIYNHSLPWFYIGVIAKTGVNYKLKNGNACFIDLSYDYHSSANVNRFYRAHL